MKRIYPIFGIAFLFFLSFNLSVQAQIPNEKIQELKEKYPFLGKLYETFPTDFQRMSYPPIFSEKFGFPPNFANPTKFIPKSDPMYSKQKRGFWQIMPAAKYRLRPNTLKLTEEITFELRYNGLAVRAPEYKFRELRFYPPNHSRYISAVDNPTTQWKLRHKDTDDCHEQLVLQNVSNRKIYIVLHHMR